MKLKNIIAASLVPFNALLFFFLIVEDKLVVPSWLQVFGRMHTVILHFPIVLILLYACWLLVTPKSFKKESWYRPVAEGLLLAAAFTASITALMGLLLSREPGYDADEIAWHKWTGVMTSFLLFIMYNFRGWLEQHVVISKISVASVTIILVIAGDLGGSITHGENFVLSPIIPEKKKPQVPFEEAFIYADLVEPVLESKCMGCHNSKKAKGELIMETKERLLKGGKDGKLWDTTQQDLGLLIQRIHLPPDAKKHMPPPGKPQLTDEEMEILYAWIKSGASFDKKLIDLSASDTLRILASKKIKSSVEEEYDFSAADEKEIKKLNNNNRVVTPLAIGSPALTVDFFNSAFYNSKQLEELKPVSEKIVQLNLENMPVKDEDMKIIGTFKNLRKLNLNFTTAIGKALSDLAQLKYLNSLSLSGTTVQLTQLTVLQSLPKLRHVYLWNTNITEKDIPQLLQTNKNIAYFTGFKGDTLVLKLTPPILQNEELVITEPLPLKLKHYINGTVIRYTLDGKDPDSANSPVYKNDVILSSEVTIKAKAFKPGWISSDIITQHFFKRTYEPDSVALLKPADAKFKADGPKTIIDLDKSDLNFANGKWLGCRNNDFDAMLFFAKAVEAKSITISVLQDINSFIFPPAKVEVWGGADAKQLRLLGSITPQQPTKESTEKENTALECSFKPTRIKFIRLVMQPVYHLPEWHPGKGQKAWVFVDEVFVN